MMPDCLRELCGFFHQLAKPFCQEGRVEQVNPMQGMFDFLSGGSAYKKARDPTPVARSVVDFLMSSDHNEMDGLKIGIIGVVIIV